VSQTAGSRSREDVGDVVVYLNCRLRFKGGGKESLGVLCSDAQQLFGMGKVFSVSIKCRYCT
jgi:hypothetical protein